MVSRGYLTFVLRKEMKGREESEEIRLESCSSRVNIECPIISLQEITEISLLDNDKLVIRSQSGQRLVIRVSSSVSPRTVKDTLVTAMKGCDDDSSPPIVDSDQRIQAPEELMIFMDLESLCKNFQRSRHASGDVIQEFNGKVKYIRYVTNGECRLSVPLVGGKDVELCPIRKGEMFGEIGVLLGTPSSAQVAAGEKGCEVVLIPSEVVMAEGEGADVEFQRGLFLTLIRMTWQRILRGEENQISVWRNTANEALATSTPAPSSFFQKIRLPFFVSSNPPNSLRNTSTEKKGRNEASDEGRREERGSDPSMVLHEVWTPSDCALKKVGKWTIGEELGHGFSGVVRMGECGDEKVIVIFLKSLFTSFLFIVCDCSCHFLLPSLP